jgi:hypothetical protein
VLGNRKLSVSVAHIHEDMISDDNYLPNPPLRRVGAPLHIIRVGSTDRQLEVGRQEAFHTVPAVSTF